MVQFSLVFTLSLCIYFSFGILGLLVKVNVAHGLLANHSLMLMPSGDVFMFEAGN